jgi:hypothetical protein
MNNKMESIIIAIIIVIIWIRYLMFGAPATKDPMTKSLSDEVITHLKDQKLPIVEVTYRKQLNYDRLIEAGLDVTSVHLSRPIDPKRILLTYANLKIDQIIQAYRGSQMVLVLNGRHYPSDDVLKAWSLTRDFGPIQVWTRVTASSII